MNINESGKFEQKNVVAMSISLLGGDLKQHIFFWRQTRSALVCELFKAHLHAARPSKNLKPSHHHQQQPKSLKVFLFIFLEVPFYLYIYFFFGWKTRISVCVCAELKYIFLPVPWVCVCVSLPQIPPPPTHTLWWEERRGWRGRSFPLEFCIASLAPTAVRIAHVFVAAPFPLPPFSVFWFSFRRNWSAVHLYIHTQQKIWLFPRLKRCCHHLDITAQFSSVLCDRVVFILLVFLL